MTTETAQDRQSFIDALGITYSAQFVPQSLSRNAKESAKSLNWKVSLSRNGAYHETDYMQGIGHVPGIMILPKTLYFEPLKNEYNDASERGKYPVDPISRHVHEHGVRLDIRPTYRHAHLPIPTLADVLYSLISDAGAVHMTFEEWCGEYGYDTDSRKAHKMYVQCSENGLKLSRMIGGYNVLMQLETLFQDY